MAKFNDIRELAQQNARWVSNSPKDWMNYLDVAARLYRYSFKDTLLIHAQRPDATACAELEVWNKKMNRWVNRGAKGIALLDDASPRAKLRYVFDIADTHLVQGGKTPILWRIDYSEHQQMILDHLADTYALTQTDSMNAALMELAQQLTAENLEEAMDGLEYEVADTFLEGLDEDNLRVRFRELMTNSIFYTLSRRCGQEPLEVLDDEDFIRIVDFNQLPVLTFLGNAVSEQCEAVLRDIGREMQKIYRKEVTEHLAKTADSLYNTSTDFSALKHETKTNITEGGKPYGTDLSPQGGLPVSEPDRTGQADEHWEVRDAAQDLSEGEQEELVSEYADEWQTESASGADRRAGGEPDGGTDREPEREVSGSEQGNRTDGMGGTPEQSDRDGGRDRAEGIGVQLTADTTEQDLSEAEEEIASAFSLPSLPTVEQQIRAIEAPMQARYADEITISAEVVDEILRTGSNRSKSQLRLIYNFMTEQTPEEYTAFVKKEYGEGGKGFEIGGTKYAVWFDELGMQISVGDTVRNDPKNKAFLSWEDVSGRIHQLLQQGEYAPKSVLDAARGNALHEHAEALSYMERDMAEGVAEMVFADTSIFSGGYPELTERLAKLLDQPEFLADLNERLLGLAEVYAEDKSVMRMQFYRPDKVSERFQKFALPYQPYQAREGFQWNTQKVFITDDEINAFLAGGGPYSDGRLATYSFFLTHTEKAERAAFLKDRYGVGGSSHALSRADDSHASYDGRGLELARGIYGKPDALVKLKWNQAAERVARLIDQSLYLKPADYSRMPNYEREQMANRVIGFYYHLPDEVERPFERELLNEDARKKLPIMLADPEQAAELLEKMDAALLSVPLDSPEYAEKSKTLAELHQYVEGTYTIFPEKKKAVEISVSETGQISLFDIWAQEQESKEHSTIAVVEEPQKQTEKYSRNVGDYLYLEDDSLYKIERVTDSLIYLKDMERPAWAARVLRPNQYDAELAKNPLNDYLLAGQESALKDSRCVYKECLYTMQIEKFGDLDDAMSCYQQVPNFHLKALGVEKTPDPLPGSLDIVQCKNGIDTIVEDYKKVPGWDNPYIQNHVVALVAEALKVQDVAVAYEINDGYFHIQTSEDGYDYTLYSKDFTVMDGGIVETDEYRPVQEVMEEVLAEHGHSVSECGVISAEYLQEQSYRAETQRAEAMKEKLVAEKPAPEASISFYVAECAEFPVMGEFHDNLTLEQALEVYDKIPAERMKGIKSIGFSLEDGSIYSGMFDMMVGGEVQAEVVNHIQHYRESPLVQKAISDMKTLLEKRQASKELEERPSTRQSVREALKNRKKAQEQQSNQEQEKPKKAKKKGEMEL